MNEALAKRLDATHLDAMTKSPKRPADVNKRAKHIVDLATGVASERQAKPAQSAGGRKGAASRAVKLTPEQREEIAKVAAAARWKKRD